MANATGLKICPKCEKELPEKVPENCPSCGYLLISPKNRYYAVPDYINFQKRDLKSEAENQYQKTEKKKKEQELTEIEKEQKNFWRQCSDEVRVAAMEDCLAMMKESLLSQADVESLRKLTTYGKQIGELSKTVENWFLNGGSHYEPQSSQPTTKQTGRESSESS